MYGESNGDVIHEQRGGLIRALHCRVNGVAEMAYSWVVDGGPGLEMEVLYAWGAGVVTNLVQYLPGQVEHHAAHRRVDERPWGALEIVNGGFTLAERAFAEGTVADPEFVLGSGTQVKMYQERVFHSQRLAHHRRRMLRFYERDGDLRLMEGFGDEYGDIAYPKTLPKSLSECFASHGASFRPPTHKRLNV
jgi:hypothetical protein